MARFAERDEYQVGSLVGGFPVCTFSPKTYHRVITNIVVANSVPSEVACYRGILGGSVAVARNLLGASNTLRGAISIPAGQAFFVRWSASGASVSDATARVSWERDDNPLEGNPASESGTEWAETAITSLTVPNPAPPEEGAIIIGADLPPCMQANYQAAIFWRPPDSNLAVDPSPYFFMAQIKNTLGPGIQIVRHGFLIYNGTDCGYVAYKNVGALMTSPTTLIITEENSEFDAGGLTIDTPFGLNVAYNGIESQLSVSSGARFQINFRTGSFEIENANGYVNANADTGAVLAGVYVNYPGASVTINKQYDASETQLLVRFNATYFTDALTIGCNLAVAIAGTDYMTHAVDPAIATQRRMSTYGERFIPGLAAGSHTLQGRFAKTGAGGNNFVTNGDDFYSLTVQEVGV